MLVGICQSKTPNSSPPPPFSISNHQLFFFFFFSCVWALLSLRSTGPFLSIFHCLSKWHHRLFVVLWLRSFTKYDQLQVHLCGCKRQHFIHFYLWLRESPLHLGATSCWRIHLSMDVCCLLILVTADYSVVNIGFARCFHPLFGNQSFSLHIVSGVWLRDPLVEINLYLYLFSLRVRPSNLCHRDSCAFPFPKRLSDGSLSPGPYPALILYCIFPDLLSAGCEVVSGWDFYLPLPNACCSCA